MKRLQRISKRILHVVLVLNLILASPVTLLGANIPGFYGGVGNLVQPAANQLPVIQNIVEGISGIEQVGKNKLIVHQDESQAIVEWKSFDIGANAWTHFDQQGNSSWSVLNRIYDASPSQIYGRLTADGSIYLINQNGILFSQGATVDVHSLVASSLNISDSDFLDELLNFSAEDYQSAGNYDTSASAVSNHGTIDTETGGLVILLGGTVENSGTITSPAGAIILATGAQVEIEETSEGSGEYDVENSAAEEEFTDDEDADYAAVNYEGGTLDASQGYVGMFGRVVNQEGLVRAVTALDANGVIKLKAVQSITLGADSITSSPISDSGDEALNDNWNGGEISLESAGDINVQGTILAHAGTVDLDAGSRIYLDSGSTIDVSGNWVAMSMDAAVASLQLNSVELADDYNQKNSILQGTTIYFFMVEGSGIGNVEGVLTTDAKTALQYSTAGGDITLDAGEDVIARSGSTIDFSGGGIVYLDGFADTTVLISDGDVYRIEEALETLDYDEVVGPENLVTDVSERWGVSESYSGTYHTGSVSSVNNYYAGFVQGDDAGSLVVSAPVVLLNGTLDGSVTVGEYQTEDEEDEDDSGYQTTLGIAQPTAGTLTVGNLMAGAAATYETIDYVVEEIVISAESFLLADDFGVDSLLPDSLAGISIISDDTLNSAGVSEINLASLTSITIDADASVVFDENGSLTLYARHIEHYGSIYAPGGSVSINVTSNVTSDDDEVTYISSQSLGYERIYLAAGSVIDVSGEKIDLSESALLSGGSSDPGDIEGGTVTLSVKSLDGEGILLMAGAIIDASGGWRIDADGNVTGGDAGTITLSGNTLILDGDLYAYALTDANGGTISLHAQQVTVTDEATATSLTTGFEAAEALDTGLANGLIISDDQIDLTGAANIYLTSVTDLIVESGVTLSPSTLKRVDPDTDVADSDGTVENHTASESDTGSGTSGTDLVRVSLDEIDESSVYLSAGEELDGEFVEDSDLITRMNQATVQIADGATIAVAPEGTIDIEGPNVLISGAVSAPAGTVGLTSTSAYNDNALTLTASAIVSAAAYNRVIEGVLEGTTLALGDEALDAGTIKISSASDVIVADGAVVDVSGSAPTEQLALQSDGTYQYETVAGQPGEIQIKFVDSFQLDGTLLGASTLTSMQGATLTITKTDTDTALTLSDAQIEAYLAAGFDDLSFASYCELAFEDALDAVIARKLTLDAAVISADAEVSLSAPWIVVQNTYTEDYPDIAAASGNGSLTLDADWIDINGDVTFNGLADLTLDAQHDIRLSDLKYLNEGNYEVSGRLETQANILINADRVYPLTNDDFTISTGGDVTTTADVDDPSDNPVYSAGGSLALEAANITHQGRWYAPMGQLSMTVEDGGRIYLGSGSVLSSAGQTMVNYGELDEDTLIWLVSNALGEQSEVESTEAQSVAISAGEGGEVIMQEDATIDISGGGGIYAYLWQASIDGSENPLEGSYVIVPGYSEDLPGTAVYLEGNDLIEAGIYTLLDESYAFMDGAIVVQDLGVATTLYGTNASTEDGYSLSTGYTVVSGTDFSSSQTHLYSVRSAEDVLAEGSFSVEELIAGDAGSLSITADTTILSGTLAASALEGYTGGTLSLSSAEISLGAMAASLPVGFTASSDIPDEYVGKLVLNATTLSEAGLSSLTLGDENTDTIVVEADSTLEAANITLTADDSITVEAGSVVSASGESGTLSLVASDGAITVEASASLHATDTIAIDTTMLDLSGDLSVDNSTLSLTSGSISVIGDGGVSGTSDGMILDGALWEKIWEIDTVILASRGEITFVGDVNLAAAGTLVLDSDSLVIDDAANITVTAAQIILENTSLDNEAYSETVADTAGSTGTINFVADSMTVDFGEMADEDAGDDVTNDIALVGADAVFTVETNLVLTGEGTLSGEGDLTIESAAIVTALTETVDDDGTASVTTADVTLSCAGDITTIANGNSSETDSGYGSRLTLTGRSIDHGGIIISPSGTVCMVATDTVSLASGAGIDVGGTENSAGGTVTLESETGSIRVADGAILDVSAGGQGDAGSLSLQAFQGSITLSGTILGQADGGNGGSFALDAGEIENTSALIAALTGGGFDQSIDLRARTGDIAIDASDSLSASAITLVADAGNVTVEGSLDVSGADGGGTLEIDAGHDLVVSGVLNARATEEGDGGEISLYSMEGTIDIRSGSEIILSGAGEDATGGSLYLRAQRTSDNLNVSLFGDITDASKITVEGYEAYENSTVTSTYLDGLVCDAATWLGLAESNFNYMTEGIDDILTVIAGIEIYSETDLTVSEAIDLSDYESQLGYGALTLRAAGDLTIGANITDSRTGYASLTQSTAERSWALNLTAGADLDSSDIMAVDLSGSTGALTIADSVLVYTENATVRFASAGDTVMGTAGTVDPMTNKRLKYNLGSFAGTVSGTVGGDLDLSDGGGIQTATGDIGLSVEGDLILRDGNSSAIGAIRTIGEAGATKYSNWWEWTNGGSIDLYVDGSILGTPKASDRWDTTSTIGNYYSADYSNGGSSGIITMAGGDITIAAGGDVTAAVGLFGEGDLSVTAGGDLNGRFLITDGTAMLGTYGNFGMQEGLENQAIEAFDTQITLIAQGSIELGAVVNPTIASDLFVESYWNLTYSEDSSVYLESINGDVVLTGSTRFYKTRGTREQSRVLPATLTIAAAEDIILGASFYMTPASDGNLSLSAGGNITSSDSATGGILMSDADPDSVYGFVSDADYDAIDLITDIDEHADSTLHAKDDTVATIQAAGDISEVAFYLAKQAELIAGRNIENLIYYGQNNALDDVTVIYAAGDINFLSTTDSTTDAGIEVGGPGTVIVAAGDSIDLGTSNGIQMVGNLRNTNLSTEEMALYIFSGMTLDTEMFSMTADETVSFFDGLREMGEEYSAALADGDTQTAQAILDEINESIINDYFAGTSGAGEGNIDMVNSQIYTMGGAGDIYVVATGEFNVGKSTFSSGDDESSGIYTTDGGAISIYVNGDLNVNESRVMTFLGGDITVWSQDGDINAGKGSKTAVTASKATVKTDEDGNKYISWTPPSVGSGIRALTYDPDGAAGSLESPAAGDIYLFAPAGEIDAGEAGIAGSNIVLAATQVVNAQNIEVGGTAMGVPDTSASAGSIGAMAGSGTVSEASNVAESQAGMTGARERFSNYVEELSETLVPKWLAVEVIGFGETDERPDGTRDD